MDAWLDREVPRHVFRYIEGELYRYPITVKRIEDLRSNMINRTQSIDAAGPVDSGSGNPTESIAFALIDNDEINHLSRKVKAVKDVIEQLPDDRRRLVELKYFSKDKPDVELVAQRLNISRTTFFCWRKEIIAAFAYRMGLWV